MKKIIIAAIIVCVVGITVFIGSLNLPRFCAYVIAGMTESSVTISDVILTREGANLALSLHDIRLKGKIEGTIKTCRVVINAARGIYFREISVSDFELKAKPPGQTGRVFRYPAQHIEVRNGIVTVSGQKVTIDSLKAENVNIGDTLSFEAHIRNGDYVGTIDIRGQGAYNERTTSVKGDMDFTAFNLTRIDSILKGDVSGKGSFSLKNNSFAFTAKIRAERFQLMDTWLRKPLALDHVDADVTLSGAGRNVDIRIENTFYKETPFALNIQLKNYEYASLELTSGFLNIQDVTSYATSDYSLQNLWSALKSGQVRTSMLRDINGGPITALLEVKDVAATYEGMSIDNIRAQVSVDMEKVDVSDLSGSYKTNRFYEVNGVVPYDENKPLRARGRYAVSLNELPPFVDLKEIVFRDGTTDGTVEVEAKQGRLLKVDGSGKLNDARAFWRNTSFSSRGSYRFSGDGIVFDPLVIAKDGGTDITCRGRWNKDNLDFSLKGTLETGHLHSLAKIPFNMTGTVKLDGEVHLSDGALGAGGDLNMDALAFEIPGYMKKTGGIKSAAHVRASKKGSLITVDDLSYELDGIRAEAQGTISDLKRVNGTFSVNGRDIGRLARIFLLPEETTGGDVSLRLAVKDMDIPVTKLPQMTGNVNVKNGFLHLPFLSRPFRQMDLSADFRGTSFDMLVNGLTCGESVLRKGTLAVKGLETPRFSLSLDMDRFNLADFSGNGKSPFRIPVIPQGSIPGRTGGEIVLRAKDVTLGRIPGKNLEIKGSMADRGITVSELKLGLFDGEADIGGGIDLSGKVPVLYANGKLARIQSEPALRALGTTKDITGTTFLNGNLKSEGSAVADLISNLDGAVALYNSDGVIRKWNFISKIFGALNLYDLFRGKVDLTQQGLTYTKFGATFTGKKGVFQTNNFLLDSPSMVLSGNGQLDLSKNEMDGVIHVSPLIVIDRTIDQIPIVRNILKEPGQGFLYLSYSVKGPLDDPDITPNVISTIGNKALELLRNVLVFPKEVFQ